MHDTTKFPKALSVEQELKLKKLWFRQGQNQLIRQKWYLLSYKF